ncbi:hypothetical protein L0Y49_01675 [bacterium]|nr:hypothetical protein [bacterium]MCI0566130.1 hypothetical protein [bacterium]MCI0679728.1 hypothetical protein [bacterium]
MSAESLGVLLENTKKKVEAFNEKKAKVESLFNRLGALVLEYSEVYKHISRDQILDELFRQEVEEVSVYRGPRISDLRMDFLGSMELGSPFVEGDKIEIIFYRGRTEVYY